jgi:hypothetical protein
MAKKRIPPEQWAEWAEARRQLAADLERRQTELDEWRERRRKRLRLLSFGLLGR